MCRASFSCCIMMIVKTTTKCLFLLLVLTVAAVNGFCYRKSPPKSQENFEQQLQQPANYSIWVCVKSHDITADLEKAPRANTTQIWFSMSHIDKLKEDQFARFAQKLVKIEIWGSKIAEIEDYTFRGLKELKGLILPRNELTIIKSIWFKDTSKLLELNLMFNKIRTIEIEFLKHLPALINLDLRGNEITTLSNDFIRYLPSSLRRLNLFNNPLNYKQFYEAVEWSKTKDEKANESKLKEFKHVFNVTKTCIDDKAITEKTIDNIDKCVEEKMNNQINMVVGNNNNNNNNNKNNNSTVKV